MGAVEQVLLDFDKEGFQRDLLQWYKENKRDLPWRRERDPYKIWVSEIMLQQTKVDTVIPYFERFMAQFPTLKDLADAEEEVVLKAWEGLGYYSRARNLHQAVKEVQENYHGEVPRDKDDVHKLRGVGPYTAGAILSIAYNIPAPAVDGNVMRVFSRIFFISDDISKVATRKKFETLVELSIAKDHASEFNQALMDLGAQICTPRSPACLLCPVQSYCRARSEGVQDQLPVKQKKQPPKTKKMKAVVLINEAGQVLIEQRAEEGLLSKLWQFPNIEASSGVEDLSDLEEALWEKGGMRVELGYKVVQKVKHVFSHLIWEIDVYTGVVKAVERESVFKESSFRFVEKGAVSDFPFPVSHQKIINGALKDIEE